MSFDPNPEPAVIVKSSPVPWVLLVLVALAGGLGLYLLDERMQGAEAESAASKSRLADAERRADEAQKKTGEVTAQLAKLEGDNAGLIAARDELSRDVAAKSNELAQLKGTYDALQDKMKAEIAKGDIRLTQSGGKLQVDLVDKILFDSGEAKISSRGEEVLQRVGAVLASIDDKQIQVSGHTDDSPISPRLVTEFPTNWELSAARATNVVRFLSEKASVPGKRLVASGYGPFHPIASNATPVGRARNRRIEILLTPLIETVPGKAAVASAAPMKTVPARATKTAAPKPAKGSKPGRAVARRN